MLPFSIRKAIISFLLVCLFVHFEFPVNSAEDDVWERYQNAIVDAEKAEPTEIFRNLTAIVDYNDNLEWNRIHGNRFVKVVTWTDWDGYNDLKGKKVKMDKIVSSKGIYNPSRDLWVTAVPELKNFFKQNPVTADQLDMRLRQLLGLPPDQKYDKFVEFWVHPRDLFRPSADPEITDHEAELDFPESSNFINVSQQYKEWFNNQKAGSYGQDGYPWTRLGYTYDWGNPDSEIGLSEFVIRKDAIVEVISVTSSAEYCLFGSDVSNWRYH